MVTPFVRLFSLMVIILLPTTRSSYRYERQVGLPINEAATNISVPVSLSFYDGIDAPALDDCPRDEVKLANGQCYQLLTQGPCLSTHYVILDPTTKKAYCGPRLCSPDRIFVFSKQLCYDPTDPEICPNGLQLYQTSYGTPVCQCPDGTYESEDDDQDDGTCESLLTSSASCPLGQVLWFRNFSSPRECVDDPCGGLNLGLRLQEDEHILVPSAVDGKCYPLGQGEGVCPEGLWFTLNLNTLKGFCSDLEDAGYLELNDMILSELEDFYGPTIQKNPENFTKNLEVTDPLMVLENIPTKSPMEIMEHSVLKTLVNKHAPTVFVNPAFHRVMTPEQGMAKHITHGKSSLRISPRTRIELSKGNLASETRVRGHLPGVFNAKTSLAIGLPIARKFGNTDVHFVDAVTHLLIKMDPTRWKRWSQRSTESINVKHHRVPRRTALPHFAPGNIFDTRLVSCRPGSQRDVNAKCRDIILPSRSPPKMSFRANDMNGQSPFAKAVPPVQPKPACFSDQIYSIQRLCVNASAALNSIVASEIG